MEIEGAEPDEYQQADHDQPGPAVEKSGDGSDQATLADRVPVAAEQLGAEHDVPRLRQHGIHSGLPRIPDHREQLASDPVPRPGNHHPAADLEGLGVGGRHGGRNEGRRRQIGGRQQGAVTEQLCQLAADVGVAHLDHEPQAGCELLDRQRKPDRKHVVVTEDHRRLRLGYTGPPQVGLADVGLRSDHRCPELTQIVEVVPSAFARGDHDQLLPSSYEFLDQPDARGVGADDQHMLTRAGLRARLLLGHG
jgi:hypothetical protein